MNNVQREAKELVDRFLDDPKLVKNYEWKYENAKQCALICIDEKQKSYLNAFTTQEKFLRLARKNEYYLHLEEVKQEIENISIIQNPNPQ